MRKPELRTLVFTGHRPVLLLGTSVLVLAALVLALTGADHDLGKAASVRAEASGSASSSASAAASPSTSASTSTGTSASASASASASPSAAASSASATASASASATATADLTAALTAAVKDLVSGDGGQVSVAVEDLTTGDTVSDNVSDDYVTASIIKLDILETLLYQDQQSGSSPSSDQRELITEMIEQSDNDAALDLYDDAGGASGITAANKVFGLTGTDVDDEAFGDTTTTVSDQILLLRQAFTADSVLSSTNRDYIQDLMGDVESDQRWGVSAAADDPSSAAGDYALKNGWLPRSATNLWEINSIGEVAHDGHEYLVAVLSSSNESMDSGIDVIEKVAKAAVDSQG
jgi:beta-lactamase class A